MNPYGIFTSSMVDSTGDVRCALSDWRGAFYAPILGSHSYVFTRFNPKSFHLFVEKPSLYSERARGFSLASTTLLKRILSQLPFP